MWERPYISRSLRYGVRIFGSYVVLIFSQLGGSLHCGETPTRLNVSTTYGVATISRFLKIIGLFCKRAL